MLQPPASLKHKSCAKKGAKELVRKYNPPLFSKGEAAKVLVGEPSQSESMPRVLTCRVPFCLRGLKRPVRLGKTLKPQE